jgi:hypothetical protein
MITIGTHPADMADKEIRAWIDYISKENPDVTEGTLDIVKTEDEDGETVELTLTSDPVRFQRIRRIIGYLVGTLDRFNNAKRKEVEDRVKHNA